MPEQAHVANIARIHHTKETETRTILEDIERGELSVEDAWKN